MRGPPVDDESDEWTSQARMFIRMEMMRRDMSYADLAQALWAIKIAENERNLRNKIARGTFSASFFLQCLVAMGVPTLKLEDGLWPHTKVVMHDKRPSAGPRPPEDADD